MKPSPERDRIAEINRRLTILNLVIFLTLVVLISIEEYGQNFFIRISISKLGEHHRRHRTRNQQVAKIIAPQNTIEADLSFPVDFIFGVSSSAFQTEGALTEGGRTKSTWDVFIDESNYMNATNSYHMYKQDVKAINQIGFRHHRLSVSWNRIISDGVHVNAAGMEHYHKVIDEMQSHGIEPIITLFHNDLPLFIHDLGGPTNPIFVEYFAAFAEKMFENFGDKVKTWITINDPFNFCTRSYGSGRYAPGISSPGVGEYLCVHNILLAHATVYRLYKIKYQDVYDGEVGVAVDATYYFADDSLLHERAMQYRMGYILNPLLSSTGGYPRMMIEEIGNKSLREERRFSRLPEMSREQIELVRGSFDFIGLNYMTSSMIKLDSSSDRVSAPSWREDAGFTEFENPLWKQSNVRGLFNAPQGLRELLKWIKEKYKNPKILITENGWSDQGEIEDYDRIEYFNDHLNAVAIAINHDRCNVIGYLAKSLLDSFEWDAGYKYKFGLFSVNRTNKNSTYERTPKKSAAFWKDFLLTRTLQKSNKFF